MKKIIVLITLLICSIYQLSAQVNISVKPELRLVNEVECNGYVSYVNLPYNKVKSYMKKRLNQYGKNVGKKGTMVYQYAKVIGVSNLVTIYAQTDKGKNNVSEVWLGILTDDKQSHQEADKILYDIILYMYQTEADLKVAEAQKEYDREFARGISLSTKLQDNKNEKLKLEANLEKNDHAHAKLLLHIEHNREEETRLKEALNNVLESTTEEDVIKKAQKHYDKAVSKGETLARKLSNNESNKLKLQENLRKKTTEGKELEVEISRNKAEQVRLKNKLEEAKRNREQIN